MKRTPRAAGLLAAFSSALLLGCVSTSFTASNDIVPAAVPVVAPEAVKVLKNAPSAPYRTVGEIEAQITGFPSDESILKRVRERAAAVGANAVVYANANVILGQDQHWPAMSYRPTTFTFTAIRIPD